MKRMLCFLALISSVSLGLYATDLPARGPLTFEAYDKNKDGVITEDEFNSVKSERMSAMANAGMPMRNAANSPDFSYFDANKDGKVTKDEFQQGQLKRMQENRQGRGRMQ